MNPSTAYQEQLRKEQESEEEGGVDQNTEKEKKREREMDNRERIKRGEVCIVYL